MNNIRFALALLALALVIPNAAAAQNLSTLTQLLQSVGGEQKSVAQIGAGKVTVVSFWATWCKPCKEEMRAMFPIIQKFQGQIEYIAISIDDTKTMARVAPFVASKGYTFTVLLDPARDLFKALNGTDVPYTLVFNADGTLHSKHDGFIAGDEVKLQEELIGMVDSSKAEAAASPAPAGAEGTGTVEPATTSSGTTTSR